MAEVGLACSTGSEGFLILLQLALIEKLFTAYKLTMYDTRESAVIILISYRCVSLS